MCLVDVSFLGRVCPRPKRGVGSLCSHPVLYFVLQGRALSDRSNLERSLSGCVDSWASAVAFMRLAAWRAGSFIVDVPLLLLS